MKSIFLLPLIFLCFAFDLSQKSRESLPEYTITSVKADPTIPAGRAQITFTFEDEFGPTTDTIRLSYNGIERIFIPNSEGHVHLGIKSGKYKFQFYLDKEHYEINTDSITIKSGCKTNMSVWFQNSLFPIEAEKPVIYVYSDKTQEVKIRLNVNGRLGFTYPQYVSGWTFTANPDGKIQVNDKTYDYLFWDAQASIANGSGSYKTGFAVGSDTLVSFLETKLTAMGLNDRERQDFITYWCPKMQVHKKNFVRFLFNEDYDQIAEIDVTPKPDNIFRVFMIWEPVTWQNLSNVQEQKIPHVERKGFTVIEWGGAEIPASNLSQHIRE